VDVGGLGLFPVQKVQWPYYGVVVTLQSGGLLTALPVNEALCRGTETEKKGENMNEIAGHSLPMSDRVHVLQYARTDPTERFIIGIMQFCVRVATNCRAGGHLD
jgi:hypothetical protein